MLDLNFYSLFFKMKREDALFQGEERDMYTGVFKSYFTLEAYIK